MSNKQNDIINDNLVDWCDHAGEFQKCNNAEGCDDCEYLKEDK